VGLLVGSSITFWSTRRSELASALVASSVLAEELLGLLSRPDPLAPSDLTQAQALWREHSPALITHMAPEDFTKLADIMRWHDDAARAQCEELNGAMTALSTVFWTEHQAFILVPLINFVRRNTLSKRLHVSSARTLPDG